MATTIVSSPQLYTFSGNIMQWVFSSNQTAQPNFSFIINVFYNGVVIATHEVFIENLTSAKIDIQTIIDSYISYNEQTIDETDIDVAQVLSKAKIDIKEKYGATPIIQSTLSSSTIYVMKGSLPLADFYSWDYNDYTIGATSSKFLTANPLLTDYGTFGIFLNNPSGALDYDIVVVDSNGNIHTKTLPNARLLFLNINNTTLLGIGFSQPQIDASKYFSFQISNNVLLTYVSEMRTIYLTKCYQFANKLTYINRFSIPEQFVFKQHERYKYNSEASTYEKRIGGWVGSDFILNPLNSGVRPIQTVREGSIELYSEKLPNNLASYLLTEINTTPYAVLNDSMVLVPSGGFELRNINDDVTQIVVSGKLANGHKSNRV